MPSTEERLTRVETMFENADRTITEIRADTAQKITEMRADTDRKIAEWRAETAQRIAEDREREERRHAETVQRIAEDRERTERQMAKLHDDLGAAVDRMRTFTISTIVAIFIGVAAMIVGMFQLTARDHDRYDAHLKESAERFESLQRDIRELSRDLREGRVPLRTTVGR